MKKTKYFTSFLFTAIFAALIISGCGDDSTPTNNNTGGTPPTINMTVGAVYTFNVDSLLTNGTVRTTRLKTTQTYASPSAGAFQITAVTQDSLGGPLITDTFSVKYEGGKFYQYGVLQLLDPNIPASWDMVADFTLSQGTQWTIADDVPFSIGTITGTADIKGKIAVDTTFHTTGWGNNAVNAFRSEITADITVFSAYAGTIYVDYFIGDADPATNPSGLVRLRLRPINLTGYSAAGADQKMQKWTP